jgi:hypothetical protein
MQRAVSLGPAAARGLRGISISSRSAAVLSNNEFTVYNRDHSEGRMQIHLMIVIDMVMVMGRCARPVINRPGRRERTDGKKGRMENGRRRRRSRRLMPEGKRTNGDDISEAAHDQTGTGTGMRSAAAQQRLNEAQQNRAGKERRNA